MEESNRVAFPGPEFPDLPAMELQVPQGWQPRHFPGTLMAVVLDRGTESFSPNLVVTHSRGIGLGWEQSEAAVEEYVATLVEVETAPRERVVLNDRRWSVFEFAHIASEVGTVLQVIAITLVEHGSVVDTIRATATLAADQVTEALPQVRAAIGSIRITAR